jgi:uridine kinase
MESFIVKYKDRLFKVKENATYMDILNQVKNNYQYPVLAASSNQDIVNLSDHIKGNCTIDFFDFSTSIGNNVYENSCLFILIKAVYDLFGDDVKLVCEYSVDHGIYCTLLNININEDIINRIKEKMTEIVNKNYQYERVSVSRMDAIRYYKKHKRLDKANVLKYISNTYVTLYKLDNLYEYFNSKLAYSTKDITEFELNYIAENGFVLILPEVIDEHIVMRYNHHDKIYKEYLNYSNWCTQLNITTASDLNKIVSTGKIRDLINIVEANYDRRLMDIAKTISENKNIKLVLLAGPSSSGKTTSSKKLSMYLRDLGIGTHTISTDDYFVNREFTPKDESGQYDFETIKALDTEKFNEDLTNLFNGKEVSLPTFNFLLGKREYNDENKLKLKDNEIIVVEGIHALNDLLTNKIDRINKFKIFISPLSKINLDDHNYIHSSDIRKLRRIVRDNRTRGHSVSSTLNMWNKIKTGERLYIYPYQDDVDAVINSSLLYELGVLKTHVEPLLFEVSEDDPMYNEALRLINFLRNFLPIPSDDIPNSSLIREFIGGSSFES